MPAYCGKLCNNNMAVGMPGVCDGKGQCVSAETNPCAVHGCGGQDCGESCLMGDLMGWCDEKGKCVSSQDEVKCGKCMKINCNNI